MKLTPKLLTALLLSPLTALCGAAESPREAGAHARRDGLPGKDSATHIQKTNSGEWKNQTITCSGFTELVLNHKSGDDTVFHLIEVERM